MEPSHSQYNYCTHSGQCVLYAHTRREEVVEYIEIGSLNGLFVLGRTIGFIGEFYIAPSGKLRWNIKHIV